MQHWMFHQGVLYWVNYCSNDKTKKVSNTKTLIFFFKTQPRCILIVCSVFFFQFLVSHDLKYDDSKYLRFQILNNCLFPKRTRTSYVLNLKLLSRPSNSGYTSDKGTSESFRAFYLRLMKFFILGLSSSGRNFVSFVRKNRRKTQQFVKSVIYMYIWQMFRWSYVSNSLAPFFK